jgi:hypothetical protein
MHRPPTEGNFMMNRRKLKKSLLQTIIHTWAMETKGTEWLIAIQLENMEVDKNIVFPPLGAKYTEQLYHFVILW